MEKIRLIKNIIIDVLRLSLVMVTMLLTEVRIRHIKKFLLVGVSLFLVISAFLIQDLFSSLWKIPVAFVMLLCANAIFQKLIKSSREKSKI